MARYGEFKYGQAKFGALPKPYRQKRYVAMVYDENRNLLAVLENTKAAYFNRRANQAGEVGFSLPKNDPKAQYLELAHFFELYRKGKRIVSGLITRRDFTGNPLKITGMSNTIKLSYLQTPVNWVWDGVDLADVYRDLLLRFRWIRKNTQTDFLAGTQTNVDTGTEPGTVMLAKDASSHYYASGSVTTGPIDLGGNVNRLERLRLATREGEKVRIKAQIRTSDDNVAWSAWSVELFTNFWEEGVGLAALNLDAPHRYVDIQLNLYTDDTSTPDNEENPTVYGFTPILDAVELVYREPSDLVAGNIPASFGIIVKGFEANFDNHLSVARNLAEKYKVEFEVDGDDRLNVATTLGTDLSNSILLKRGENINVTVLSDDDSNIANVVTCLGKGDGVGQLATVLRNETSIAAYGERPGRYENKDCEDMATLIAEGNAYLTEHAEPKQAFQVDVLTIPDAWPDFRQGDLVRVVDPYRQINSAVRILDEKRQDSEKGERVTLGLNAKLPDFAEMMAGLYLSQYKPPTAETTPPRVPGNFVATGVYQKIILSWTGKADHYVILHSPDNVVWNTLETHWTGNSYTHEPLAIGTIHYYKIQAVRNGIASPEAGPVNAAVGRVYSAAIDPNSVIDKNLILLETGTVPNGTRISLPWPQSRQPHVTVSPKDLLTFDPSKSGYAQKAEVYATEPWWDEAAGRWKFDAYGRLLIGGVSTNNGSFAWAHGSNAAGDYAISGNSPANSTALYVTMHSGNSSTSDLAYRFRLDYKLSTDTNWTLGSEKEIFVIGQTDSTIEKEVKSGLPPGVYNVRVVLTADPDPINVVDPSWRSIADSVIYNGTIAYVVTA